MRLGLKRSSKRPTGQLAAHVPQEKQRLSSSPPGRSETARAKRVSSSRLLINPGPPSLAMWRASASANACHLCGGRLRSPRISHNGGGQCCPSPCRRDAVRACGPGVFVRCGYGTWRTHLVREGYHPRTPWRKENPPSGGPSSPVRGLLRQTGAPLRPTGSRPSPRAGAVLRSGKRV
jgi:hypothetical protein